MNMTRVNLGLSKSGRLGLIVLLALVPLLTLFSQAESVAAQTLSLDPNMDQVWKRTDLPVANGSAQRTWIWGPKAFEIRQEDYAESPGGKRLVAYFDKTRMEINNPNGDRSSKWFVTNGLLVKELISGQQQVGDNTLISYLPAEVPAAGDLTSNPNSPTYASLYGVTTLVPGLNTASNLVGQFVTSTIDREGKVGNDLRFANKVSLSYYDSNLGHNIANVFWDYFQKTGPVVDNNGVTRNGQVVDWTFAMGLPITEPYWARVTVGGQEKDVLIQAFERRVLTYTPDNTPNWRVEMGNVGLHYYQWRSQTSQPTTCTNNPVRGFGKVWADNYSVRLRIGCPYVYTQEQAVQIVTQHFEHGWMLWIDSSKTNEYYGPWQKTIYVMFEDGTYAITQDTWDETQPVNGSLTPPAGKFEPQRGLGKVWRDATGLKVRERLGWATEAESGAPGAVQGFGGGTMLWSQQTKQVYVLYRYYGRTNVWEIYADTFVG
ncbi:MAG: hypothetical protein HXX20_12550 [Chloroflexi bacterium]|nr:hypothetical protein [Chloroflexota bacterium]